MRTIHNHVEAALLRGIAGAARLDPADRVKPIMIVEEIRTIDWASATFIGARITLRLRLEGAAHAVEQAVAALAERLPDWEFRIGGQIVADIEFSHDERDTERAEAEGLSSDIVPSPGPSTVSRPFVVYALVVID